MSKNKKINELIKLDKPLVIFDLETTGLSTSLDRIVEIAYLKIAPDGEISKGDIFLNPEISIPKEASEVHGITNEQVENEPTFKDKARELFEVFSGCDYGGFNIVSFDLPMLKREFMRAGLDFDFADAKIIDSKVIYHHMEPRTLSAAYKFYCKKEHEEAHSALGDVEATTEILGRQLEQYEEIRDWEFVYKIHHIADERFVDAGRKFFWRDGEAYFAFSKYRGQPLREIVESDAGFLEWVLGADFSEETKEIVRKALDGELPKKG